MELVVQEALGPDIQPKPERRTDGISSKWTAVEFTNHLCKLTENYRINHPTPFSPNNNQKRWSPTPSSPNNNQKRWSPTPSSWELTFCWLGGLVGGGLAPPLNCAASAPLGTGGGGAGGI